MIFRSIGQLTRPFFNFPPHAHPNWEIIFYTHGTGIATVGEQVITFEPGVIICMPPTVPHSEVSAGGYRNIFMHVRHFPAEPDAVPTLRDASHAPIQRVAQLLTDEFAIQPDREHPRCREIFGLLSSMLTTTHAQSGLHPAVERLRHALHRELSNPQVMIENLLAAAPLSPDHLRKLFREQFGHGPREYLIRHRLALAKQLLQAGGYQVQEVATRCGFADPLYFSRQFRKRVGVTAGQYAEGHRTSGA